MVADKGQAGREGREGRGGRPSHAAGIGRRVRRTKITGLGTYVPPRLLTNADFEKMVDTTSEWIVQRTGIRERHIVDPGVGSTRRALAAQADPYVFVAPDNGVLSAVFNRQPPSRLVEISQPRYVRATVSRTFEGRDRFAPAAAWLARGVPMASLGPTIGNWERIAIPSASPDAHGLRGEILRIDRFGNLITNVDRRIWNQVVGSEPVIIRSGGVAARLVETYGEIAAGEVGALFGSSDRLELAVCEGSAVERLGLRRGDEVLVTFASAMRSTS